MNKHFTKKANTLWKTIYFFLVGNKKVFLLKPDVAIQFMEG